MTQDLFSLQDMVVVLSGGSGLIGREAVLRMAAAGASLVVGVRDTEKFDKWIYGIKLPQQAQQPICLQLDIADPVSINVFFERAMEQYGRIDALVNNAWPRTQNWLEPFESVDPESLYKNLCDHSGGYFLCCQKVAEFMKQRSKGVILNMGSIYGAVGPNFSIYEGTDMTCAGAYPLIKGGIHTFTKYLATYLGRWSIRVNCLVPGGVSDGSHQDPEFQKRYCALTPLGRMAEPVDIVGPMIFLLSEAARYVTGVVLPVDGGWTAW